MRALALLLLTLLLPLLSGCPGGGGHYTPASPVDRLEQALRKGELAEARGHVPAAEAQLATRSGRSRGRLLYLLGRVSAGLGNFGDAETRFSAALETLGEPDPADRDERIQYLSARATAREALGDHAAAGADFRSVHETWAVAGQASDPEALRALLASWRDLFLAGATTSTAVAERLRALAPGSHWVRMLDLEARRKGPFHPRQLGPDQVVLLDSRGRPVTHLLEEIGEVRDDHTLARRSQRWGLLDPRLRAVIPFLYQRLEFLPDRGDRLLARLRTGEATVAQGILDLEGKVVSPFSTPAEPSTTSTSVSPSTTTATQPPEWAPGRVRTLGGELSLLVPEPWTLRTWEMGELELELEASARVSSEPSTGPVSLFALVLPRSPDLDPEQSRTRMLTDTGEQLDGLVAEFSGTRQLGERHWDLFSLGRPDQADPAATVVGLAAQLIGSAKLYRIGLLGFQAEQERLETRFDLLLESLRFPGDDDY